MCYKNKKIYDKLMINISFNRDFLFLNVRY